MDNSEARAFLSLHREGEAGDDTRFREAMMKVENDPDLAAWWRADQRLDDSIAAKLQSAPVPADLKRRILAGPAPAQPIEFSRVRRRNGLLALAAALAAFAVIFSSWRGPFQPANSLADFRDEMTSFIKVDPTLELSTHDLSEVETWLAKNNAPSQVNLPKNLRALTPVGCRKLRFRGHDVALICFRQNKDRLAHIFVMDRNTFPRLPARASAKFGTDGEWSSAAWSDGAYDYFMMIKDDRAAMEKFLNSA